MSADVAWFISKLIIYENQLPIGSPTSQLVAFWSYKDMFDEILEYSLLNELKISVFVDDISFSSNKSISKNILYNEPFAKLQAV